MLLLLLQTDGVAGAFTGDFYKFEPQGASLQLFVPRAAREELKALGPDFQDAYKVGWADDANDMRAAPPPQPRTCNTTAIVFLFSET